MSKNKLMHKFTVKAFPGMASSALLMSTELGSVILIILDHLLTHLKTNYFLGISLNTDAPWRIRVCVCVCVPMCMCVFLYRSCMCVCVYALIYMCAYILIYAYIDETVDKHLHR